MQKIIITEEEKKKILQMHNSKVNKIIINEALDYSKPILSYQKVNDYQYNVFGFLNFKVTSSDIKPQIVVNAINDIKNKFKSENKIIVSMSFLDVKGGCSNYLNGAMKPQKVNPDPNNPAKLQDATINNTITYDGEKNREKNLEYAKARAEVVKNALVSAFPPSANAKINTQANIIDTGGVIDEKMNEKKYPVPGVPGQQAIFTATIDLVDYIDDIQKVFTETKSYRSGKDNGYYGAWTNSEGVKMCKIISPDSPDRFKNTTLGLTTSNPKIKLTPFEITFQKGSTPGKYKIVAKTPLTKTQWMWVHWYFKNASNKDACQTFEQIENYPEWLKTFDPTNFTFGAMNAENEFVHDKSKHEGV